MFLPTTTRALVLQKAAQEQSPPYHDVVVEERPVPALKDQEVLVRIAAVALNHRDLWIRKGEYPSVGLGYVMGSDGAGMAITKVASARQDDALINTRVFLTPSRGWKTKPEGPEAKFGAIGGVKEPALGTFAEYVVVDRDEVVKTPSHLDDEHAAAWPLAGVTAWRAVNYQAQIKKGHNVLITGIGGGAAIIAQQLAIGIGANVYITSGSQNKIDKAIALGAKAGLYASRLPSSLIGLKAGFNYKSKSWSSELAQVLKEHNSTLDAVIDSAGGDILGQTSRLLKAGGKVVCYGMTASPKITFTMREVFKHLELKGTAMGSQRELIEATNFIAEHKIVPTVSRTIDGLENFEEGFEAMKHGTQFGKIVIRVRKGHKGKL